MLLVGGSSRIPLVAQMVTLDLGRPVAVDARPKDAIALGAALAGWQAATATPGEPVVTEPAWTDVTPETQPQPAAVAVAPTPPPVPEPATGPFVPTVAKAKARRGLWIGLAAAAVVALLGGFFAFRELTAEETASGGGTADTEADENTAGENLDEGLETIDTLDEVLGDLGGEDTGGGEFGDQTITTIPGDDWGPAAEAFMVDSCTNPSSGLPGSPRDTCQCVYDYLAENADFDEYKQADIEFQESGDDFSKFPPVLIEAAGECGAL